MARNEENEARSARWINNLAEVPAPAIVEDPGALELGPARIVERRFETIALMA